MSAVTERFCSSPERAKLLRGLLTLRSELRALGIVEAVQWLNGSFCEDVESTRGRPPADIDVVTLLVRPAEAATDELWEKFNADNQRILDHVSAKLLFGCDAYYIDATFPAWWIAPQITYWFGLFTHQRVSNMWKGILEVPLCCDDAAAMSLIESRYPV